MKRNSKNEKMRIGIDKLHSDIKSKPADEATELAESIIDTVREPLLILDKDLRVVKASQSFFDYFKVSPGETVGTLIYDLGNRQWDIPKLKELLENILPEKTSFDNYEVEHDFAGIGNRILLLNARQIERAFGKEKIILLAIEDITERKHLEESLSETSRMTSEYLDILVNHAHVPIIIWDASYIITRFNHAFEKLSGYEIGEVIGRKVDFLFPEEKVNSTIELLKNSFGEKKFEVIEIDILRKDKDIRTVLWNSANVLDKEGRIIVATIAQDITAHKRSAEAIGVLETRYRRLFESAKDGILILDAETGKIIDVNPFLVELLGYSQEKFKEMAIWEIGFFKDIADNENKFFELQQKEYVRYEDLPLKTFDGRKINVEFVSNVYLVNQRKVVQCNIRDISERKRAEEKLNLLSARQSAILDSVPDIIMEVDKNKIYTWANFAGTEFFGDDVIGKEAAVYFEGEQNTYSKIQPVFDGSENIVYLESLQRRKDGEKRLLAWRCRVLKDQNGNVTGVLSAAQDITEQKHAEAALRENEKFLKETQKIAQLGSYTLDVNTGIWKSSEILDSILGIEPDYDKSVEGWTSIIHPEWQQLMADYFANEVVGLKKSFDKDYKIVRKSDKSERWVHCLGELVVDKENKPIKMIGTIRGITELKNAEREIVNLNRIYALLSNTNEVIVRTKERQKLFNEICRIAIDNGKFRMAWIGIVNNDTNKVDIKASAGLIENYLEDINIDLSNEIRSEGPVGKAIKNGTNIIINDIEKDKNMLPWKENALRLDYKSCAIFPLNVFGKVIGVFSIYSSQKDFFHQQEIRLLDEMAMDISFALEFFETEKNRITVEGNLRKSEEQFRSLYENSTIGLYRTTPDGTILMANKVLVKMLGYPSFEVLASKNVKKGGFGPSYPRKDFIEMIEKNGEVINFESEWIRFDGTVFFVSENAQAIRDSNGNITYYDGVVEDITERKQMENELRESASRLNEAMQIARLVTWEYDVDSDQFKFNDQFYKIMHTTAEREGGYFMPAMQYSQKFVHPDDISVVEVETNKALETTDPNYHSQMDHRVIFADGEEGYISVNIRIDKDSHGRTVKTYGVNQDITERKNAEEEITMLAHSLRSINECVSITDLNDKIIFVNQSFLKVYGYEENEVIGKQISMIRSSNNPTEFVNEILPATIQGEWQGELLNKRKDGSEFPVHLSTTIINDKEGKPLGLIGVASDITVQKQMIDDLLKLSSAVEQSPASIIITDIQGNIEYVNLKAIESSGYQFSELLGRNPKIFSSGEKSAYDYKVLWDTISSGKEWRGELHNKKKNSELYWEYVSISAIKNNNDELTHYLAVKEDITERKSVERELIDAKERAEQSDKLKSEFLAQMSHEIRTPLGTIVGNVELLSDFFHNEISPDILNCFNDIDISTKRIIRTMDLLLNTAELQTSHYKPNFRKVDLDSQILVKLFEEHRLSAKQKGLDFIYKCGLKETIIFADEYSVYQIFANLIDNAIKYTDKGKVEILLEKNKNGNITAEIKDTGIGINKEFLPRIFDSFAQEDQGYSRKFEGNGLGLFLVKKYCGFNNAVIEVDSEKNIGSTFRIIFA